MARIGSCSREAAKFAKKYEWINQMNHLFGEAALQNNWLSSSRLRAFV
jgi:hypothetical protein